jgi:hypothetical protein
MIKKTNWDNYPNMGTAQKRGFRKVVDKAGNLNRLSRLTDISRGTLSNIAKRKITSRKKDLMFTCLAQIMEKAVKIKGIAEQMCPSLKRLKKL